MGKYHSSRLGVGLGVLLHRGLDLPPDDILSHIVLLDQVEELSELGRTLGTESLGEDIVGQSGDLTIALLDDDEREDGNVGTDDAPTDALALAPTVATSVYRRARRSRTRRGSRTPCFMGNPCLSFPPVMRKI